jgi:adenine-specific DNA-methyltransferase
MAKSGKAKAAKVETLTHEAAKRRNIPTAELEAYMADAEAAPRPVRYRRNPDLDPQLVWRGKDEQDSEDLTIETVPIYIQEKIHPKAIIDDLRRQSARRREAETNMPDLFADFNGLPDEEARLEFYAHNQNWSNRMILGDALLVMNSLAEKEGLRGQVQCIYMDPPYGIKFGSNWQASTKRRDVQDGKVEDTSREPEVIKAFRDTWELGIHSYLSYLRDRFLVSRELLSKSGSIFVQINDENAHIVRSLLDETFGSENYVATLSFLKTSGATSDYIPGVYDIILFYARNRDTLKYRQLYLRKEKTGDGNSAYSRVALSDGIKRPMTGPEKDGGNALPPGSRIYRLDNLTSQSIGREKGEGAASWFPVPMAGQEYRPSEKVRWKTNQLGMANLLRAGRLEPTTDKLYYVRYLDDFAAYPITNFWRDTVIAGYASDKRYVVETSPKVVERCLLMTTDPGDLVLDPTCGGGTTAFVAEQWGRRWITIDTSRVALTLARTRLMAARYSYYLPKDSREGAQKEADLTGRPPSDGPFRGDVRHGFIYERVPHITLKSIASNTEIGVVYEKWQQRMEPLRAQLNAALGKAWEEWEIPRAANDKWADAAKTLHEQWWAMGRERQAEIDASIARNANVEMLYDRPYEAKNTVRVAGPFTVESLSPHRVLPTDEEDDALLDALDAQAAEDGRSPTPRPERLRCKPADGTGNRNADDFVTVVLENLKAAGVQNTKKGERLAFTALKPWAGGRYVHAEGRYMEGERERRAAICIGPEYGTVSRELVRQAAREAVDLFDVLVVCGFAFDPHVGDDTMNLGRLTVLKARMNQDLHMAEHLRKTGAGNLFVVFGEPDVELRSLPDGQVEVEVKGIDIFDPTTGEVRGGDVDDIACWFIDTDYDEQSFFVRQAYFLGSRDPYERLKRTLKAEIDEEAWATLHSAVSRPFSKPSTGRIAVKVINHYGDEVLKVYDVA